MFSSGTGIICPAPAAYRITPKQVAYYNSLVAQLDKIAPKQHCHRPIDAVRAAYLSKRDGSGEIEAVIASIAYFKARAGK
jgi:hypothetical protein